MTQANGFATLWLTAQSQMDSQFDSRYKVSKTRDAVFETLDSIDGRLPSR